MGASEPELGISDMIRVEAKNLFLFLLREWSCTVLRDKKVCLIRIFNVAIDFVWGFESSAFCCSQSSG